MAKRLLRVEIFKGKILQHILQHHVSEGLPNPVKLFFLDYILPACHTSMYYEIREPVIQTIEVLQSMGFIEHFIWKLLPPEATDYGLLKIN